MVQTAPSSLLPPGGDPFEGTAYRWLRPVGGGGMGEVHVVEHIALGTDFLAKVLHAKFATHEQLADRVRVEAQSLARLEHPNIVQVKGFGRLRDGRPFIIMELLSGHTLESEIQTRERLPLLEVLRYGLQLASALAAAHALGIVHRDIKPDNLFLHHEHDDSKVLKVLDFGVARILPGVSDQAPIPLAVPTDTGIVVGTPRYVSPEAAVGRRVDHRADIYGAGLVLYIMLTGRGPFDHIRNEQRLLAAHVHEAPAALSTHSVDGLTPELQDIVSHALAKNPNDRIATAQELEARLAGFLQRTLLAADTTARARRPASSSTEVSSPVRGIDLPQPAQIGAIARPVPASAGVVSEGPRPKEIETPVPVLALSTERSPLVIAAIFVGITVLVGLAAAGLVSVVHRMGGGG